MEIINIDFKGHMEIDKDDIHLMIIDKTTGNLKQIDTNNLSSDEIIEGFNNGVYYISFSKCYDKQLDGSLECELDNE